MAKTSIYNKNYAGAPTKGPGDANLIDPFISGYYYLVWTRKPSEMVGDGDGQIDPLFFSDIARVLNNAVTLPGATLNTTDVATAFSNASKISMPTSIERDNTFSVKFSEMSGLPIIRNIEKWVFGIRDPLTGLSSVKDYSLKNISGELLVILTKPILASAAKDNETNGYIEKAYLFTNVFPTNVPDDVLSPNLETQDKVEVDIQFKFTNCITSPNVDKLAETQLNDSVFKNTSYLELPSI